MQEKDIKLRLDVQCKNGLRVTIEKSYRGDADDEEMILFNLGQILYSAERNGAPFATAELYERIFMRTPFRHNSRATTVYSEEGEEYALSVMLSVK